MIDNITYEEFSDLIKAEPTTSKGCLVMRTLAILSGKWRMPVVYQLYKRPSYRFGELRKSLPQITNTMLTSTLRDLEELGIVGREQFNEIPPHVEYSLTDKGKALFPVFYEMAKWSETYLDELHL